MMAKLLTAALSMLAFTSAIAQPPSPAPTPPVQIATAVTYTDSSCTTVFHNQTWPVNLCHPYPTGNGMGSRIYQITVSGRFEEKQFPNPNCSGSQLFQQQLDPTVGAVGNCVQLSGYTTSSGQNMYANSIMLSASSRSSFMYQEAFSDQSCSKSYGVYMLGNPITVQCRVRPAGQALPPTVPSTSNSFTQQCDSSGVEAVCTYDSADCSGQPNKCQPPSALSGSSGSSSTCMGIGNWGSQYVYVGPAICPSKALSHEHKHDDHTTMMPTTGDSHAGHEHEHEQEHDDHTTMVNTTGDSHADHDHKHTGDEHAAMNKTDDHSDHDHTSHASDSKGTPASGTPVQKNVISGDFEVEVAEDQESKLKDAKVITAFQKAYASFVNVADNAVTVKWVEVDHSGHNHRRLRSLQAAASHHQGGTYEIKTDGLTNSTVQAAVNKLKMVRTSTSKANELKTVMNRQIQAVPGMTSLQVKKVMAHNDPVIQQAQATQENNADFATQTSCPWMHYSWFIVALFMKTLI